MGDWTYEAKDFLTPAPYEALYQFHGQPFVHETKLQELSVYAANQGFRGFKSMYKKYIESLKAQAGTVYVDIGTSFMIIRIVSIYGISAPCAVGARGQLHKNNWRLFIGGVRALMRLA